MVSDPSERGFKPVEVCDVITTRNPYLVVHETIRSTARPEPWTVSHVPSGTAIAAFDEIEQAFMYVETVSEDPELWAFGKLGDSRAGQPPQILELHLRGVAAVDAAKGRKA